MKRFKRYRLWLVVGLGVIPFTGLPMAVQVGLAVGVVVALMALSAVARNPGTVGDSGDGFPTGAGFLPGGMWSGAAGEAGNPSPPGAQSGAHTAGHSGGQGGGAADTGQAAAAADSGGGGDGGGGDGGGGGD